VVTIAVLLGDIGGPYQFTPSRCFGCEKVRKSLRTPRSHFKAQDAEWLIDTGIADGADQRIRQHRSIRTPRLVPRTNMTFLPIPSAGISNLNDAANVIPLLRAQRRNSAT